MGQLRAKLEADPADPQRLLTEPGVGYRIDASRQCGSEASLCVPDAGACARQAGAMTTTNPLLHTADRRPPPSAWRRADPRRDRRRLRRHRHQPAVHPQGDLRARHRRAARPRPPDRRGLGDLLGADAGGHAQVRDPGAARRQPRRGRGARAHRAGGTGGARPARTRAALLLLGVFGATLFYGDSVHHSRDLGARRDGGTEGGRARARSRTWCRLPRRSWSGCSLCSASARQGRCKVFGPVICCGS